MKQIQVAIGFALAATLLPFANSTFAAPAPAKAAAPAKPKALTPAELKRLRNDNASKARNVLWQLEQACQNQKRNGSDPIKPLIEKYLEFFKIPENEGRPTSFTPSYMHRTIADAISSPLNLRLLPEIQKHMDEAVKTAKTPEEKAEANYSRARFMFGNHLDDTPEKHEKIILDTFQDKALSWNRRLDMLRRMVEYGPLQDIDAEKIGWDIVKDEPKGHYQFYNLMLRVIQVRAWKKYNQLKDNCSTEHIVELCDRAIADPAVDYKLRFISAKANALVNLRQLDQAEQILLSYSATTNDSLRYDTCMELGEFYKRTAVRYYDDPDAATLKKAITAYAEASLARPRSTRPLFQIGEAALKLKDYDLAIRSYKSAIPLDGGKTNITTAVGLGNAYYGKKDWETAALYYGLYPDRLNVNSTLNYCRSLFILKRYEETAKWLKKYEKLARGGNAKDEARYFQKQVEKFLPAKKE